MEEEVKCSDCRKAVPRPELKDHIRLKLFYFPYLCYVCKQEFLSSEQLEKIHFPIHHPSSRVRVLSVLEKDKEMELSKIYEESVGTSISSSLIDSATIFVQNPKKKEEPAETIFIQENMPDVKSSTAKGNLNVNEKKSGKVQEEQSVQSSEKPGRTRQKADKKTAKKEQPKKSEPRKRKMQSTKKNSVPAKKSREEEPEIVELGSIPAPIKKPFTIPNRGFQRRSIDVPLPLASKQKLLLNKTNPIHTKQAWRIPNLRASFPQRNQTQNFNLPTVPRLKIFRGKTILINDETIKSEPEAPKTAKLDDVKKNATETKEETTKATEKNETRQKSATNLKKPSAIPKKSKAAEKKKKTVARKKTNKKQTVVEKQSHTDLEQKTSQEELTNLEDVEKVFFGRVNRKSKQAANVRMLECLSHDDTLQEEKAKTLEEEEPKKKVGRKRTTRSNVETQEEAEEKKLKEDLPKLEMSTTDPNGRSWSSLKAAFDESHFII